MTGSLTDKEYASLLSSYGPGLSIQDMRLKAYGGPTTPAKSVEDLASDYFANNGGSASSSRTDNESKFWPGNNSTSDDKNTANGVLSQVRTNYATNPRAVNLGGGWTTTRFFGGGGGAGTYSYATAQVGPATTGITTCRRKTWTAAPTSNTDTGFEIRSDASLYFSVLPGDAVTISLWMKAVSPTGFKGANLAANFYDRTASAGAVFIPDNAPANPTEQLTSGVWTRLSRTHIAPAGALGMRVVADVDTLAGQTVWAIGDTLDATGLLIEEVSSAGIYFDGDTPDTAQTDYAWVGTINNSNSTATPKVV